MFSEEEIKAAKQVRDAIVKSDDGSLKSVYMAGEICMWDEMRQKEADKVKSTQASSIGYSITLPPKPNLEVPISEEKDIQFISAIETARAMYQDSFSNSKLKAVKYLMDTLDWSLKQSSDYCKKHFI